jgi:Predicted methyltransferase regulatory domain/Methyltransferase domain
MALTGQAGGEAGERPSDVPYLRTFSGDLAPAQLRLVAALNGFTPPRPSGFDYCELGAGNGDTTAALAAANPTARFVGVDVNADHVAFGSGLARRGGLANLRFLELDFAELASTKLPDFDFIGANGVLSWVSPEKRRAMIAVASAKLAPGGLFYVSYNALPGWAAVEPLRRLMLDSVAGFEGTDLERARRAVSVARLLCEGGAGYFAGNPAAVTMLETMVKMGLPYVVYEYLKPHWHPRYFADVALEMASQDLHFIGQLPLHLNYRDLALTPAHLDLFKGVTDRIAFENLKDFALNEFFRRDVYIKGRAPCAEAATRSYLETTAFGTMVSEAQVKREDQLPSATLRFQSPLFDALIPALAAGAKVLPELLARPDLAPFDPAKIREAILHLVLGGQVFPMAGSTPELAPAEAEEGLYRIPLAYNRMMLAQRLSPENPIILASPAAGTGLVVPQLEAISLRLLTEVEPAARVGWIRSFVARQPLKLRTGDRVIEDGEEKVRILEEQLAQFCVHRLPKLIELGVVAKLA